MSRLDKWKKKKEEETYRFRGETKASLEAKREALEQEKERLRLRNEIREQSKEIKRLEHPTQEKIRKGIGRAGGKIVGFVGTTIQEGARVGAVSQRRLKKRRKPRTTGVKLQKGRTFATPTGSDISLAGNIARNQIIEDNLMTKDFFGSGNAKELLEHKDLDDLVGSSAKKKKIEYI